MVGCVSRHWFCELNLLIVGREIVNVFIVLVHSQVAIDGTSIHV